MVKIFTETNKISVIFDGYKTTDQDFIIDILKTVYVSGVKCFMENNKLTISLYENSEKTKNFIKYLIELSCSPNEKVIEKNVEGLISNKLKIETVEISGNNKISENQKLNNLFKYNGMSCDEALDKYGSDALIDICSIDISNLNDDLRNSLMSSCKNYVNNNYGDISDEDIFNLSIEEIKKFILKFSPILNKKTKEILNRSSFASLNDLLDKSDNIVIGSAYKALVKELIRKFN